MPTTITKSIGTTGRDYSTLQAWEDAIPANLVTADEVHVGECYNDSEFTGAGILLSIASHTTDATRFIKLTTGSGQSFMDHANKLTNGLRYNVSNGVGIRQTSGSDQSTIHVNLTLNVIIEKIQVRSVGNYGSCAIRVSRGNVYDGGSSIVQNCIMESTGITSNTVERAAFKLDQSSGVARNCLIIMNGTAGNGVGIRSGASIYNCTIVRPSDKTAANFGIRGEFVSNSVIKNCAVFGFTDFSDSTSWHSSSNYNQSDDATNIPGANSNGTRVYANQFEQSSAASGLHDFRLKTGSDCNGAGTPDSTHAPADIVGTTRDATTPDVGAWEFTAVVTSFPFFNSRIAHLLVR